MSIYNTRRDRALDDDPAWERIMLTGTSASTHPAPVQSAKSGARMRKASPANYLLPTSIEWLRSLPRQVRPVALATKYARIVNLLAQQWNDHHACCSYFDALLADRRGDRRGFAADVLADIRMLQEYYFYARQAADRGQTLAR